MRDGELIFGSGIDAGGFEKYAGKLKQTAQKLGSSTESVIKGMLGANLIKEAGKALLDFGKQSVAAASDLQEVQNVVDVTFGESAGVINTWAKNAKAQYGLTEMQAKQFNGTMGAMLKSMGMNTQQAVGMSTSITGLAADMASFYNLDHETAFEKIRSGISGETEPLTLAA